LPAPLIELDTLDHTLLSQLIVAGSESNREIGRRLGVADGTVKARVRRFEESGLVRIFTGRDPVAFGDLLEHAIVFLRLEDPEVINALEGLPGIHGVHLSVGSSDAIISIAAPTDGELSRTLTRRLRKIDGVTGVEMAKVLTVIRHQTHLVRLVDGAVSAPT
jgi:Lrp/AsnC family transcriptional regulator for asnA, asnC and gidA